MKSCNKLVNLLTSCENGEFSSKEVMLVSISLPKEGIEDYDGLIVDNMKVYRVYHDSIINYWLADKEPLFDLCSLFYEDTASEKLHKSITLLREGYEQYPVYPGDVCAQIFNWHAKSHIDTLQKLIDDLEF